MFRLSKRILILFFVVCSIDEVQAQAPRDFTLPVSITILQQPYRIQLTWPIQSTATAFYFGRKSLSDTAFQLIDSIKTQANSATQFIDSNVAISQVYEYHIRVQLASTTPNSRNIYVVTGTSIPPEHHRGAMLMLVDSTLADSLQTVIRSWHENLTREGWRVYQAQALRSNQAQHVPWVKSKIKQLYQQDPRLNTVLIIGHIPVPYSGRINPDGHPDHLGAWPADGFYGDMDSLWKDDTVNIATAARVANHNIPGDGKFDESHFYTNQLAIGRIDLSNLPIMGASETALYQRYFVKNQAYRHRQVNYRRRALIQDNLTGFAERFSQGAWKSFSTLIGLDSITHNQPYGIMTADTASYLFSYAASTGTYTSAQTIVSSNDFAVQAHRTVFTQLIGSYFGDWDSPNNLMRSALAGLGGILTCQWGGRPQHFFHHMAIGKTIGYSTLITMNNKGQYFPHGFSLGRVHQSLQGDPTLQANYLIPQPKPSIQATAQGLHLSWPKHPEQGIQGYYLYRSRSVLDSFVRLNDQLILDTSFFDTPPLNGQYVYFVRAARLDTILRHTTTFNQGTYWNLSPAGIDSIQLGSTPIPVQLITLQAQRQSSCVDQVTWEVGDESSIAYYELTASSNGQHFYSFHPPARVLAKNQPGSSYSITTPVGNQPPTTYRLRIVNQAQEQRYSMMAAVTQRDACRSTPLIRYQNHALYWENLPTANGTLSVFSSTGQRLYSSPIQQSRGNLVLPIHRFSGWCHVRIDANDATSVHQRIWIGE